MTFLPEFLLQQYHSAGKDDHSAAVQMVFCYESYCSYGTSTIPPEEGINSGVVTRCYYSFQKRLHVLEVLKASDCQISVWLNRLRNYLSIALVDMYIPYLESGAF